MSDIYEIRLKGHLDSRWSDRFDGFTIHHQEDGTTLLVGPVPDQAALHGLLIKVRDLALPLIALVRVGSKQELVEQAKGETDGKRTQSYQ